VLVKRLQERAVEVDKGGRIHSLEIVD
jgi:hypothetical protein